MAYVSWSLNDASILSKTREITVTDNSLTLGFTNVCGRNQIERVPMKLCNSKEKNKAFIHFHITWFTAYFCILKLSQLYISDRFLTLNAEKNWVCTNNCPHFFSASKLIYFFVIYTKTQTNKLKKTLIFRQKNFYKISAIKFIFLNKNL